MDGSVAEQADAADLKSAALRRGGSIPPGAIERSFMQQLDIYIAGPMRGYPNHNFDAFMEADRKLRRKWSSAVGLIYNPAQMDLDEGFDPSQATDSKQHLKDCMTRDLNAILKCDAIYMLPGWEKSEGAKVEHALAVYLGLKIFYET